MIVQHGSQVSFITPQHLEIYVDVSQRHNSVHRDTTVHDTFVNWLFRIKISFSYCHDCIKYVRCRLYVPIFMEPVLQLI